ncbi:hypothetical protein H5410_035199 [Solanum commersonii]|uniref:Uncharacterized protein n=1 Tax=Solanum commersonii TaxID=4109 RepID=A0A9J5Y275_SOLCO|nr:hypothetical protein H5410_035199 [Solanum commersonii]
MFLNGCLTKRANSLASTMSSNSASTFSVPLILSKTRLPLVLFPCSIKLFGVSGRSMPPTVITKAGAAAKPKESLHPHGWSLLVP